MKPEEFCYWLQGFFEMSDAKTLNAEQTKKVKAHLNLVFAHSIDPSYVENLPVDEQLAELERLQRIHDSSQASPAEVEDDEDDEDYDEDVSVTPTVDQGPFPRQHRVWDDLRVDPHRVYKC